MIALEDRCNLAQDITDARDAGARLKQVCDVAGINARTLQRWKAQQGLTKGVAGLRLFVQRPAMP